MVKFVYEVSNGCTLCGMCIYECPVGAIKMTKAGALINKDLCRGCGLCADNCASEAIVRIMANEGNNENNKESEDSKGS